jgi:hypothetical protein
MSSQKYTTKPFWIERGLFGSAAYKALVKKCRTACIVLGLLWERRKMEKRGLTGKPGKREKIWVILNNGEIELPYLYLRKRYKIPESTYSRAIQALEEVGFVDVDKVPGRHGLKNVFTFVDRWKAYGTKEYQEPAKRDRRPINGGFKKKNKHGHKFTAKTETTAVDESQTTAVGER